MEENDMKHKNVTVGLFLGVLFLFFILGIVMPKKSFSPSENRYLAGMPKFTVEKLMDGSFGTEYETYLSDQFPMRDQFVAVKAETERLMLEQDVNGVYFGADDYYIEKFDPEMLFTEQLTKNLDYLTQAADQFAKQLGENHVKIMLVPSASQILTNKLPLFAAPADQGNVTRILKTELSNPDMLLPIEEELGQHKDESIYYRTDHHWTVKGAYYGYRLYGESMGFKPWEEERFVKETVTSDFFGTIESKVKVPMKSDDISLYLPKEPQTNRVFYDGLPKEYNTLYNREALNGKDKYSVFLDGNHGWTKIVNDKAPLKRRLLIVKDSYAHSFAPFVVNHFEEVHMIDLRYFNMKPSDFIRSQGITDVLVLYQIPGFAKEQNLFKMPR